MAVKQARLSRNEKQQIANRINYFRTLPSQVRNSAANLESGYREESNHLVNHELKSVLVGGRIMVLNCN